MQVESDAEITPRRRIASIPYAFTANTLVSGALISGNEATLPIVEVRNSNAADANSAIVGVATASSGRTTGIWGQTDSNPGTNPSTDYTMGVGGYASSPTGHTFGVWGGNESSSPFAVGVLGNSLATSGEVYRVQGIIHSTISNAAAISGYVATTSGKTYAVYGNGSVPDFRSADCNLHSYICLEFGTHPMETTPARPMVRQVYSVFPALPQAKPMAYKEGATLYLAGPDTSRVRAHEAFFR